MAGRSESTESRSLETRVTVEFRVNGSPVSVEVPAAERLIATLRERLGLKGAKEGCGEGQCGTCTVLLDNRPVNSCLLLTFQVRGREVSTIEGLGRNGRLDPLQQSFIDHGAIQCGFCTPGMIMAAKGLLLENPDPGEDEIRTGLAGNLCRCTGYLGIIEAIKAAARMGGGD